MLPTNIDLTGKRILVTGAAGFIGYNLCRRLLWKEKPAFVFGIDNVNDYYDPQLKEWRLKKLKMFRNFLFVRGDIADKEQVERLFMMAKPDIVVNLAAQAGVRYSISHPDTYIQSNIIGFYNILEACRHSYDAVKPELTMEMNGKTVFTAGRTAVGNPVSESTAFSAEGERDAEGAAVHAGAEVYPADTQGNAGLKANTRSDSTQPGRHADPDGYQGVQHLVYASSSSVYGGNTKVPFSTEDKVDTPVSLYAATKKSNELLAHAYAKLYNIPSTGLRFFTVYGPAGRPDMAYFGFTDKLRHGEKIRIFNYGNCKRDFTYIDDIVEGITRVMRHAPERRNGEDGLPVPPYKIYNIGNGSPVNLLNFVDILQQELVSAGVLPKDYDFEAHKELVPMQPGDVPVTYADTAALAEDFDYKPSTDLRTGLCAFAQWYREYYK